MIDWPSDISFDNGFTDHFSEVVDSVMHDDGSYPRDHDFEVIGTGDSRIVYDVADHCDIPVVLKIAYNDVGTLENRREALDRSQWDSALRPRLVPVLDSGHGYEWAVFPRVSTSDIRHEEMSRAQDELRTLVSDAGGDPREVYPPNIGKYDDEFVLLDHGGL